MVNCSTNRVATGFTSIPVPTLSNGITATTIAIAAVVIMAETAAAAVAITAIITAVIMEIIMAKTVNSIRTKINNIHVWVLLKYGAVMH
jgi:D-alanyl-D-alanine dipeptidase